MSEILHEPYRGARDDNRIVDYAFLLGASGRMPTFEYVGEKTSSCFTRPLALTGNGGRLLSSGEESELRFAGISAADAGEKTLVLGGDSSRYNIVSNIFSGAGSVAVAKEGSGRWIVSGENNISGKLDVRAGRLELWDRYAGDVKYTYYRLVVKNAYVYSGPTYITEFALYDKNGVNRVASLKFHEPDDVANLNSAVEYQPINISELKSGEAFFYSASGNKVYHYPLYNKEGLDKLFDGGGSKFRLCATPYTGGQPNGNAGNYVYIVMRLAEDAPPILHYDIIADGKFTVGVEASYDGEKWVDLTGDVLVEKSTDWKSGDEFVVGHPNRPGRGFTFDRIPVAPDADGSQMLADVTSVQVAPGATLAAKGNAQTIDSLTVDCSVGSGTLENIDFAEGGTINLVNIPERADVFEQPVDFGAVSAESLANINEWAITVDGKASTRWEVEISSTSIRGVRRGMKIIVR
jgi:autotransporter-associated beta strand protein